MIIVQKKKTFEMIRETLRTANKINISIRPNEPVMSHLIQTLKPQYILYDWFSKKLLLREQGR